MNLPIVRKPLEKGFGRVQTYTHLVSGLCQLQWDYLIEWTAEHGPEIKLVNYRCFQRKTPLAPYVIVDESNYRIPFSEGLMIALAHESASYFWQCATVSGNVEPVSDEYRVQAQEAAKKGYDMRNFRRMMQQGGPR